MIRCNRCRKRKTKCLGGTPCRSCLTAGAPCAYPPSPKKIRKECVWTEILTSGEVLTVCSYVLDLEARVKAYENERDGVQNMVDREGSTPQSSTPQSMSSSIRPSDSETGRDDIDKNPLIEGTAQLVLNPEGERRKYSVHRIFAQAEL
jgi:proline utilization trans-activator